MTISLELHGHDFLPHLGCDVKLSLPHGIHVLKGENGIGKSSLLRALIQKYENTYRIVLAEQKPLEFFFDRPLKKFREIIFSSGGFDQSLFNQFWERSGFTDKESRLLSRLSGGEAQFLKLICICSAEADTYFVDEPGQYLDPDKRKLAAELLEQLASKNKTLLIVEHDPSWLNKVTSTTELMVDGNTLKGRIQ